MKNTIGSNITLTVFGESHGNGIGVVVDGVSPGMEVNENDIKHMLSLRRPSGNISTQRREEDEYTFVSGVFNGKTTGTPLCIVIENKKQQSKDYSETRALARPGHADYAAFCKYRGYEDFRGGGHFSGRVTAGIVAAGAIFLSALKQKGIYIGTHISELADVKDREFENYENDIAALYEKTFPVLSEDAEKKMIEKILEAKSDGDSVGGILSTAIAGLPSGLGEPWFESVESKIAQAMFAIGGVKGIEFGKGFAFSKMFGSTANDSFEVKDGKIVTETNNNAGINGGITNGMPVLFRIAVKPTPSIYQPQATVDFMKNENANILIEGRHDPCIVHRVRSVVDSLCSIIVADMLAGRYGTDYFTPCEKNTDI